MFPSIFKLFYYFAAQPIINKIPTIITKLTATVNNKDAFFSKGLFIYNFIP